MSTNTERIMELQITICNHNHNNCGKNSQTSGQKWNEKWVLQSLEVLVHKMLVNCINKGWGKKIYSGETWQTPSSPSDQN